MACPQAWLSDNNRTTLPKADGSAIDDSADFHGDFLIRTPGESYKGWHIPQARSTPEIFFHDPL